MNLYKKKNCADGLWNVKGDFDEIRNNNTEIKDNCFYTENGKILLTSSIEKDESGVYIRKDRIKNISDEDVTLNTILSRFSSDGGEYEVYSQYNGWQNESKGEWQSLVTAVSISSESVRNAHSATPFIAIWSKQQNRGVAIHINAYSAWEILVKRTYYHDEVSFLEIELGVLRDGLNFTLSPNEELEFPEILYYDIFNKTDMDCWKIHNYFNKNYPRKQLPVLYNTWLYKFDKFTKEDILKQIEKAKEIGVEYFVIDAGWFGNGKDWYKNRGDWEENLTFGFRGEMAEISDAVRKSGMKFGFWLEPECASPESDIFKTHPDYFVKGDNSYFIDFANEDAKMHIYNKACQLIDRYNAEFVKFDFNDDLKFDKYNSSFIKYEKGHTDFIRMLRKRYPDLYIENCASGGMRMTARDGKLYDSFWPTDNQSPYYGLDILKNSLLRMPPQWIESWISICSAKHFSYSYTEDEKADKIFSTNDATWTNIVSVNMDFLYGFMTGRPVGLSFDLTALTNNDFEKLKDFIENFKQNRNFWQNAVCHIITDTESMLVLEFTDLDFERIELLVFTKKAMQDNICVYPKINNNLNYTVCGKKLTAQEITENGIDFPVYENFTCKIASLVGGKQ